MTHAEIKSRATALAERSRSWMLEEAFPFWAERTPDPAGGFFEKLDLSGKGIPGLESRVRLQARMGFTFALAAELGWDKARADELTERSVRVLVDDCRREDGLFGKLVRPGHGLTDDTADAYDTAFALLAFASAYRMFGSQSAFEAGKDVSRAIDDVLIRPANEGGFNETLPAPEVRDQNPHMHLTEASLAWYEASQDARALERAQGLAEFVEQRFYRPDASLLVERAGVSDDENRVEAGHMFEWAWILGRLRELGGEPSEEFATGLHDGGMKLIKGLGYLPLSQRLDGRVIDAKQRTWGPTEKLKGHIAHWRQHPSPELAGTILKTAEMLFADHVDGAISGAWIDVISPDRDPLISDITPATGYHIFLALKELIDWSD